MNTYKVLIVGEPGVGKSSITRRWQGLDFDDRSKVTMGAEFSSNNFEFHGYTINYQFWDIAGQDRSLEVSNLYVRNAAGIFFVFDMSVPSTLKSFHIWINNIKKYLMYEVPIVILANKLDYFKTPPLWMDVVQQLVDLKFTYCFTSAKTNDGLFNAREVMAAEILNKEAELGESLALKQTEVTKLVTIDSPAKSSWCC